MKKKIIQVWCQQVVNLVSTNKINFWGIGDLIRGTIATYQLAKKYNFDFEISIALHPISNFTNYTCKFDDFILSKKNNINFIFSGEVENHIINSKEEIIYFLTNEHCNLNVIDNEIISLIKEILNPNEELQKLINEHIIDETYVIYHFRLGDNEINNKKSNLNYVNFIDKIKLKENKVIITDSNSFKKYIKNNNQIKCLDLEIGHLGYENDLNIVKNTLCELNLVKKSSKIYTYSVYSWISGFVYWISIIYNIPIEQIK